MRIVVDYRPALRQRTGVGEYIHELIRAYVAHERDSVVLFSSSWKDRLPSSSGIKGVKVIDRRIPVRVLNYLWHRAAWPPIESLAGETDVVHAAHPLLIPARRAAQVVTIHDLFFLSHPEKTRAEIRRDYAPLVAEHARRADAVITSTHHGRQLITNTLGVPAERVYVCFPGAPQWERLGREPHTPREGYILFFGTLEARKNIGTLLDAYALLLRRLPSVAPLLLAGRATPDAADWLSRIAKPPLAGYVTHLGYVPQDQREPLYAGARVVTVPSLDEGFGLPALEAMSAGVPVIVSNRGALPEVVGDAGILFDAASPDDLSQALERVLTDDAWAADRGEAGLGVARMRSWQEAASTLATAYSDAVERRRNRM